MTSNLQILQLNVRKQAETQLSLLNDKKLEKFGALAIQEPHARMDEDSLLTSPMHHPNWSKLTPTVTRNGRWPIRSMLWINSALESKQLHVPSPDITAALISLTNRSILVVSVYIEPANQELLHQAIQHLRDLQLRVQTGSRVDTLMVGDFNLHDQLWGGNEIAPGRQGEADSLVDLMSELGLSSLLPRGTKTWHRNGQSSTIDLVLAGNALTNDLISCQTHPTEHGSDHRAIETIFDIEMPPREVTPRLLLKNAPWKEIREHIADTLRGKAWGGTIQEQTDRLMGAVSEAIYELTPKAVPSPYAKRWWTADLTQLRKTYTYWRNRARAYRRATRADQDLQQRAREAGKDYHDAIRRQKRAHWQEFLAEDTNIWKAAKYLQPTDQGFGAKIPPLVRTDGSTTGTTAEQAT
jgi:exonuclease III